ncbi:MAG: TRAP transporter substrate-binding protein [Burkholderiaceae bacterium]
MKRIRQWILGTAATLAVAAAPAAAQTTLNFSNWIPPQAPFVRDAIMVWAKQVEDATQGRVKVRMLPKAVTSPPQHVDAVRDGLADATFIVHGYSPGRFVVTEGAQMPFFGDSAVSTSLAYNRVYRQMLEKADEHKGVKVLSVFTHGPGQLFLTSKRINRYEDLAGLKFRTNGGNVDEVSRALGLVAMNKPATEVYEMLNSGVADGTSFSFESILTFKVSNLIKQVLIVPGGFFNTSFALIMNENKFKSLSAADQKAIMDVSGDSFARLAGRSFDDSDAKGKALLQQQGAEFTMASPEFVAKMRQATQPVVDGWIKKVAQKGVDGKAVLEALRAEAKKAASE